MSAHDEGKGEGRGGVARATTYPRASSPGMILQEKAAEGNEATERLRSQVRKNKMWYFG